MVQFIGKNLTCINSNQNIGEQRFSLFLLPTNLMEIIVLPRADASCLNLSSSCTYCHLQFSYQLCVVLSTNEHLCNVTPRATRLTHCLPHFFRKAASSTWDPVPGTGGFVGQNSGWGIGVVYIIHSSLTKNSGKEGIPSGSFITTPYLNFLTVL